MKRFAVACTISKSGARQVQFTSTLMIAHAPNAEDAQATAMVRARALKPGWAINDVLCLEIETTNHEPRTTN